MGVFFWNKQRQLEGKLSEFRKEIAACVKAMVDTFEQCRGEYDPAFFAERSKVVHSYEGRADDMRREIEVVMYSKALFPESRGDVLNLVEAIDKIANQAEKVVWKLRTQRIVIPVFMQSGIVSLAKIVDECSYALLDAAAKVFSNFTAATEAIGKVDHLESEADRLEVNLIEELFASSLDGFQKLMVREVIHDVARVSDRAENAADRIRIMVAKRSI